MIRILLSFLFLLSIDAAFAQAVILPNQPAAPVAVAAPDPSSEQKALDDAERVSQQIRAEERKTDFENSGLQWLPLNQTAKSIQDFISQRDKYYKSLIGNGRYVDVAVYDMDANSQPDIVLFFWDHCGKKGCLYKIYFDRKEKKPASYYGWDFIPYKKGVMLDHAYYSL